MGLLTLPALALAATPPLQGAPTFTGDAADVAIAGAAWDAAAACTGRQGRAQREVPIEHRTIMGGYLGVAHTHPDGTLYRIDLNTEPERHHEVLVHEVAHAWVSDGPIALVEGSAELLADCIVRQVPGLAPLQYDDGRDLTGLHDLIRWAPPDEHTTESLGAIRTDAYLAAARLMRTAEAIVPPGSLWPEEGLTWDGFLGLLADAGPEGAALLAALEGGAATQREALADADLDGVPRAAEAILGTSDDTFDTDGDGWWDGARDVPEGAVPVPLDGTPVCSGRASTAAASVRVHTGGNLRGQAPPRAVPRPGSQIDGWTPTPRTGGSWGSVLGLMPRATSILVQLDGPPHHATGAAWATVEGRDLTADPGCTSTPQTTVWAHDPALIPVVEAMLPEVEAAIGQLTDRYGPLPTRLAVALGGPRSTVTNGVVWLSTRDVSEAVATEDIAGLARLAASVHHVWTAGDPSWRSGEAVANSLSR